VWSEEFKLIKTLDNKVGGHSSWVYSVVITSDGLLISGSSDNTVKVW
jgi:WD40 repeat protein